MYFAHETSVQFWHLPYAFYLVWISGLMMFSYIINYEDPEKLYEDIRRSPLMMLGTVWVFGSVFLAYTAWPLLYMMPMVVVTMGAPMSAGVLLALYAAFAAYLGGRLFFQKRLSPAKF